MGWSGWSTKSPIRMYGHQKKEEEHGHQRQEEEHGRQQIEQLRGLLKLVHDRQYK